MITQHRDQRKAQRRPMRRPAVVSFAHPSKCFACVVWDMSGSGARLAIACPTAEVPHKFDLLLTKDGAVRRSCEIVWTNSRFVGVKFLELGTEAAGRNSALAGC
jgi:hypothetical protein